jgi:hypothetical protein
MEKIQYTEYGDLVMLSWRVGILYYQIYQDTPSQAFYDALPDLLTYEALVEVQTDNPALVQEELSSQESLPIFGMVTLGMLDWHTSKPSEVIDIVEFARKSFVPYQPWPRSESDEDSDDDLYVEGCLNDDGEIELDIEGLFGKEDETQGDKPG